MLCTRQIIILNMRFFLFISGTLDFTSFSITILIPGHRSDNNFKKYGNSKCIIYQSGQLYLANLSDYPKIL